MFLVLDSRKIIESRNAYFFEDSLPFKDELNNADVKNRAAEVKTVLDVDSDGAVDHGADTEGDLEIGNNKDAAAQGGSFENDGAEAHRSPD